MFPQAELFTSIYDPRRGRRRSPSAPSTARSSTASPARAPLPEAAAADERAFRSFDLSRLRPRALEQPRVREERAQGAAARCTSATATRRCATRGRRASSTARTSGARCACCCRRCSRGCAAQDLAGASGPGRVRRELAPRGRAHRALLRALGGDRASAGRRRALPRAAARAARGCYLVFGRVVPYKRVDLAVAACAALGRTLQVAGDGRALAGGRAQAPARARSFSARSPRRARSAAGAVRARCCFRARRTSGSCPWRRRRRACR